MDICVKIEDPGSRSGGQILCWSGSETLVKRFTGTYIYIFLNSKVSSWMVRQVYLPVQLLNKIYLMEQSEKCAKH
jgi:hypothetical protein